MRHGYYGASVYHMHYVTRRRCGGYGSSLLMLSYRIDMLLVVVPKFKPEFYLDAAKKVIP